MGILDNLAARFGYIKAASTPPSQMLAMAEGFRWDMPTAEQAERQMQLYAALTWISTAVDRTAEIAASAKFSVTKISGEPGGADDEQIENHPFEKLLNRPNPSQSRSEFVRDAFTMFRITGNLYLYKNAVSENAPPDELWIIPSNMIRPIPDGRSYVMGYEYTPPGMRSETIEPWRISHMKTSNPLNPFVGLSALQSLALDAYGDIAQQKWALGFFDKNNAKLPTILAFKHMVGDPEWNKIKAERDREWGGVNRSGVTLLRGVGDSLQVLQASSTQKDMEFLQSRNFTKEEIYGKLAPGLASILAVNATEANAIAGKATLIEFGVWPTLVQMAEKFNADILPLYGDDLRGEFEDIRQTNRILDLQEQAEYAKYHTVNEVRAEYYGESELELHEAVIASMDEKPKSKLDPRGFLFPAQIGPNTPAPEFEKEEEEEPPAAPPPSQFGQAPEEPPRPEELDIPDEGNMMAQQEAELKAWERFAVKRLGKTTGRDFEPRVLPLFRAARVKASLRAAKTADDIRHVFEAERAEPDMLARAVAALERYNAIAGA